MRAETGGDRAGGFDVGEIEAEDGGHGALAGGDGGLHELAAEADGADGVGEGEGAGGDVGGVLAEGVAGGVGDGEIAGGEFGVGWSRARRAAMETVRMAGWVCSVSLRVSSGPLKMMSEREKPRASSASSKTARAAGKAS